ncbi:MAG: NYN domain-containing protein [Clostridia bacterium]|nr:NYN domain-containing protein [Clostridia bacterium]
MNSEKRFAVLIDAENTSYKYIKTVFDEITNEGRVIIKRLYGDLTKNGLNPYKEVALNYGLRAMHAYAYTEQKNSSDSAMIIDAMEMLYKADVDGFCLVSSDSDFTNLAMKLKEEGKIVIGMGKECTPKAFVVACDEFKFLDKLQNTNEAQNKKATPKKKSAKNEKEPEANEQNKTVEEVDLKAKAEEKAEKVEQESSQTPLTEIKNTINRIVNDFGDDDGWMLAAQIVEKVKKLYPDFNVKHFGCKNPTNFFETQGYEVRKDKHPNNLSNPNAYDVYVRVKN